MFGSNLLFIIDSSQCHKLKNYQVPVSKKFYSAGLKFQLSLGSAVVEYLTPNSTIKGSNPATD